MQLLSKFHVNRSKNKNDGSIQLRNLGSDLRIEMTSLESYKQNENDYVKGINSPHGRITILFDTIISNLEKLIDNHPKTDFISLGKCLNGITILASSLNIKEGGEVAQNLVELY